MIATTTTNIPHSTPTRTVGQQAYIIRLHSKQAVTVKKITPAGRIYVSYDADPTGLVVVFNPNTNYSGTHEEYGTRDSYLNTRTLNFDKAHVDAGAAAEVRSRAANYAVVQVKCDDNLRSNSQWSKEALLGQVAKLEAALAAARTAVEAI